MHPKEKAKAMAPQEMVKCQKLHAKKYKRDKKNTDRRSTRQRYRKCHSIKIKTAAFRLK